MWEWHGLVATCIRETRASCYMYRETGAIAATCVWGLFAIICGSGRYIYMKTWSSVLVQGRQGLVRIRKGETGASWYTCKEGKWISSYTYRGGRA